ncbi:hypothetical protein E8E15_000711 [Penicillium rubens]|uniref:Uncharacterized protein n=1 Tax=Penicillium chrysogenum TaxID=5076 RepID=A0ABQ8WCV7_PENCH|nr:hypothetical protein E8E15_000711 [Penicillium rubens]KAJ5249337.1 hypothetical protein N7524_011653 [Penicillium chrysogenum]KAJ5264471.1 hypothetical protein N7505_007264 [Penicillium chrysogenum]
MPVESGQATDAAAHRQQASDDRNDLRYQFTEQQKSAWGRLWQAALDHQGTEEETSAFRHHRSSALECALVYALAALGHDSNCWLNWRSYADLLDKAIRIAQSFMVQHTLRSGSDSEDHFEGMERKKAGDSWGEVACEQWESDFGNNFSKRDRMRHLFEHLSKMIRGEPDKTYLDFIHYYDFVTYLQRSEDSIDKRGGPLDKKFSSPRKRTRTHS